MNKHTLIFAILAFPYLLVGSAIWGGIVLLKKIVKGEWRPHHDMDLGKFVNTGRLRFKKFHLGIHDKPQQSKLEQALADDDTLEMQLPREVVEPKEDVVEILTEDDLVKEDILKDDFTEAITEKMPILKFEQRTLRYRVVGPRRRRVPLRAPVRITVPV